ncbi:MAG: tetratricopeptide repeat protein [Firmicutes bacterium]|nr:tetratricopeptide repeat protein [Bacillota bacterium]
MRGRWRWGVLLLGLVVVLSGCASSDNLIPQSARQAPSAALAYQQAVEVRYRSLSVDLDQAIRAEEVVLAADPGYAPGYIRLAGLLLASGEPSAAVSALTRAAKLEPHDSKTWTTLGQLDERLGRTAQAISAYRHALAINPGAWMAWDGLGFVEADEGQYAKAWRNSQRALMSGGEQGPTLDLMGWVLYEDGDAQEALTFFNQAASVQPDWWQSYYDAGLADIALGHRHQAVSNFTHALSLNPTAFQAWELRQAIRAAEQAIAGQLSLSHSGASPNGFLP